MASRDDSGSVIIGSVIAGGIYAGLTRIIWKLVASNSSLAAAFRSNAWYRLAAEEIKALSPSNGERAGCKAVGKQLKRPVGARPAVDRENCTSCCSDEAENLRGLRERA